MNPLRCVSKLLLACLAFGLSAGASAEAADSRQGRPDWACWYEAGDLTIRCRLVQAPGFDAAQAEAIRQSVDRRLPNAVGVIWATPEKVADRVVSIPLWNVPSEWAFARELAASVMCGVRRECEVSFDLNPDGRAPARAAALQAGAEAAEVLAEIAHQWQGMAATTLAAADEVAEQRPRSRRRRALAG